MPQELNAVRSRHRDSFAVVLEQLQGRRDRLQRELSAAEGSSISTMNQRTRLLKDIGRVEEEIRTLTTSRRIDGPNKAPPALVARMAARSGAPE